MSKVRRQERRSQRKARRQVKKANRLAKRADRREDRAERARARGNNNRANRIERRSDRAEERSQEALDKAEDLIGGNASTHRLEARLLSCDEWEKFIDALKSLKADPDYWDDIVEEHHQARTFAHNRSAEYRYGFLTWHRQYLLDFEEDLQEIEPDICIPYWDWRSTRRVPKHMKVEEWMNLESGRSNRASAPGRKIQLNKFEKIDNFTEMSDTIELLHDSIHGTLGGDMRDPMTSPNDPIFFMHHAFVDKMWDYWQKHNPTIAMDHPFPDDELPGYGNVRNADVMDSAELGVQYF